MALTDKLSAIAEAIRAKTGGTAALTLAQMPAEIADIQTGVELNFEVVGGTSAPTNPGENTIWVNTDTEITSWTFSPTEPGVCDVLPPDPSDPHFLAAPHKLSEGEIINFVIPATVSATYEAIRIYDSATGKLYYVRNSGGTAGTAWTAGTKVALEISNDTNVVGSWGDGGGSAYVRGWGSYKHDTGAVWIQTDTSSDYEFNALKDNAIQVYPLSASQWDGTQWTSIETQIYQNGAWNSVLVWNGELYNAGNEYSAITGGWTGLGKAWNSNYYAATPTLTRNDGSITATLSSNSLKCGFLTTFNDIDLTDWSTLTVDMESYASVSDGNPSVRLCAFDRSATYGNSCLSAVVSCGTNTISRKTVTLDVSSLSGSYAVGLYLVNAGSTGCTHSVTMYDMHLS